jgi:hypothetical protein
MVVLLFIRIAFFMLLLTADADLYKSLDGGETWALVSTIFSVGLGYNATETTLVYVDDTLYAFGRGATKTMLAKSIDDGVNWTDYTELDKHIAGSDSVKMPDDQVVIYGRGTDEDISFYKVNNLTAADSVALKYCITGDIGYGSVIKDGTHYYFTYTDGPVRTGQATWANPGIYFKKIGESLIE